MSLLPRRPLVASLAVKCSGTFPCHRCVELALDGSCHYARKAKTGRPRVKPQPSAAQVPVVAKRTPARDRTTKRLRAQDGARGSGGAEASSGGGAPTIEDWPEDLGKATRVVETVMRSRVPVDVDDSVTPVVTSSPAGHRASSESLARAIIESQRHCRGPLQASSTIEMMTYGELETMCVRFIRSTALSAYMLPGTFEDERSMSADELPVVHRMILLLAIATVSRANAHAAPSADVRTQCTMRSAAAETDLRLLGQGLFGVVSMAGAYAQFVLALYYLPLNESMSRMYAASQLQVTVELANEFLSGRRPRPSTKVMEDLIFLRKAAFTIQVGFTTSISQASSFTSRNLTKLYSDLEPLLDEDMAVYTRVTVQTQLARSRLKSAIFRQWERNGSMDLTALELSRDEAMHGYDLACVMVDAAKSAHFEELSRRPRGETVQVSPIVMGMALIDSFFLVMKGTYAAALGDRAMARRYADLVYDGCVYHMLDGLAIEPLVVELLHYLICVYQHFADRLDVATRCIEYLRQISRSSPSFENVYRHDQQLYDAAVSRAGGLDDQQVPAAPRFLVQPRMSTTSRHVASAAASSSAAAADVSPTMNTISFDGLSFNDFSPLAARQADIPVILTASAPAASQSPAISNRFSSASSSSMSSSSTLDSALIPPALPEGDRDAAMSLDDTTCAVSSYSEDVSASSTLHPSPHSPAFALDTLSSGANWDAVAIPTAVHSFENMWDDNGEANSVI